MLSHSPLLGRLRDDAPSAACLPVFDDEARDVLIDLVAEHLDRGGYDDWLAAPILEPTARFFPDRYEHGAAGVQTVARRLIAHARLDDCEVDVFRTRASDDFVGTTDCELTHVDDVGIELTLRSLGSAEEVPLALAQEVGRYVAQLDAWDNPLDAPHRASAGHEPQPPTDLDAALTAFELGFGLLIASGSHRYRAEGAMDGAYALTRWNHRRFGIFAPEEACFLLAVQAVVRRIPARQRRAWAKHLGPNQAALLARFVEELTGREDELADRLELPPRAEWPPPREPDVAPLPDPSTAEEREDVIEEELDNQLDELESAPLSELERREPVFRHRRGRALPVAYVMGIGALCVLIAYGRADGPLAGWACLGVPVAIILGYALGRAWRRAPICSECDIPLAASLARCPGCRRAVEGELRIGESHLDALEHWYAARGGGPSSDLDRDAEI